MAEPRWATPSDDAALRELARRTPMRGPVSYTLEREPEFFALTRLQGDAGGRVAVIEEGDAIVAMLMYAPMRAWIGGEPRRSAYIGDLKVDPAHRQSGLAGRLLCFLGDELKRERIERSSFLVLAGNPMLLQMESGGEHFGAEKLASIRNYFLLFGRAKKLGGDVTSPSRAEISQLIELWNRVNGKRAYAPVLDEALFARWRPIDDFRVVRRDGRIVAFCAAWDATAMKQIRVLRLSPTLRISIAIYNLAARVLRLPRFPRAGGQLRFLYAAHVCAEDPRDLEMLLAHIHDEHRRDGYLYIDIALDLADPLVDAIRSFRSMHVDFELWEALTPGSAQTPSERAIAYFDISLV